MMLDESLLREVIEGRTVKVGDEEYGLRLVGVSETPNQDVMLAIAIGGTEERLQLHLSRDLRCDSIALRQRVVYFVKRIVMTTRQHTRPRMSA
jgi:hypothetical protein